MEFLIIAGLIIWAVVASSQKKQQARKQQEQQEQKKRQAILDAEQARRANEARPAAPLRPRVQPAPQPQMTPRETSRGHIVQPSWESGHAHTESSMTGVESCPPATAPSMDRPLADRLSEFKAAKAAAIRNAQPASNRKPLQSSLTNADARTPIAPAETAPVAAFSWDPAQAQNGLIYAEILGKPKALRR